jgi:hypothetical protein
MLLIYWAETPARRALWLSTIGVFDEPFERGTIGLPSFGVSGKKVGDLHCSNG